jgi:hypothetical protein
VEHEAHGDDEPAPPRTQLHLFPDHSAGWPVWDEHGLTRPEDFPDLSPRLVEQLVAWQERWEGGRGNPERYRSMTNAPDAQAELDRLARHLAGELRDVADVRTDTWSSTD